MCGSGLPGLPAVGCLPTCPPAAEAQTSPLPGPQCASSDQCSPKNLSASANPPCTFTSLYPQHHGVSEQPSHLQPTVCRGEPGWLHSTGIIPNEAASPQDQLMPQHRSDVLLPEANSASRREMESLTAPGSGFSQMSQPFQ